MADPHYHVGLDFQDRRTEERTMEPVALTLQVKLGSLAVHIEEFLSPKGHDFDRHAIKALLDDPEVSAFLARLSKQGFLPVKR